MASFGGLFASSRHTGMYRVSRLFRGGDRLIERCCSTSPSVPHPSLRKEWGTAILFVTRRAH